MTKIHRIEFWMAIATPLSGFLASFYLFCLGVSDLGLYALAPFISGVIPFVLALPLAISAIFHSKNRSSLSLFPLVLFSIVFCGLQAFLTVLVLIRVPLVVTFLFAMPILFAIATTTVAIVVQLRELKS